MKDFYAYFSAINQPILIIQSVDALGECVNFLFFVNVLLNVNWQNVNLCSVMKNVMQLLLKDIQKFLMGSITLKF